MIDLKCPDCGANLSFEDGSRKMYFCQYCGAKIVLQDTVVNNYKDSIVNNYSGGANYSADELVKAWETKILKRDFEPKGSDTKTEIEIHKIVELFDANYFLDERRQVIDYDYYFDMKRKCILESLLESLPKEDTSFFPMENHVDESIKQLEIIKNTSGIGIKSELIEFLSSYIELANEYNRKVEIHNELAEKRQEEERKAEERKYRWNRFCKDWLPTILFIGAVLFFIYLWKIS